MGIQDFLRHIEAAGFTLNVLDNGNLWVTPANRLNDKQRQFIKAHKPEIVAALTVKAPGDAPVPPLETVYPSTSVPPMMEPTGTDQDGPTTCLWRYRTPDGRLGELYSPSGLTLDEARRYAPPGALDLEPATLPPESPPHFLEQTHICPDRDDRVTCGACGNLSYGQCLAAGRGLVDAPKRYKPHLTILRWCAAFVVKGGRVAA